MSNNNWFIESISLTQATTPPTKEEMEKLLPSSWPPRWEEIERYSGSGSLWIKIGHLSPDPYYAACEHINVHLLPEMAPGINVSKYDFTADLRVTYVKDLETDILDLNESKFHAEKELLKAKKLLQESGGELSEEERSSLEELVNQVSQVVPELREIEYLGEKARETPTPEGKIWIPSVSIGRFVLNGSLIGSEQCLKPGSTRIHSVKCNATRRMHEPLVNRGKHNVSSCWACRSHNPCSTLKAEGFIHREELEQLFRSIFSKIKGEKEEAKEVNAEIERGGTKIKNPKEKFEVKKGDTIKTDKRTQVNIADGTGNKMWVGGGSDIKINEPSNFELLLGTITAFLQKLKPKSKFEIHTPTCSTGVRGTTFTIDIGGDGTSIVAVLEGEVGLVS